MHPNSPRKIQVSVTLLTLNYNQHNMCWVHVLSICRIFYTTNLRFKALNRSCDLCLNILTMVIESCCLILGPVLLIHTCIHNTNNGCYILRILLEFKLLLFNSYSLFNHSALVSGRTNELLHICLQAGYNL